LIALNVVQLSAVCCCGWFLKGLPLWRGLWGLCGLSKHQGKRFHRILDSLILPQPKPIILGKKCRIIKYNLFGNIRIQVKKIIGHRRFTFCVKELCGCFLELFFFHRFQTDLA